MLDDFTYPNNYETAGKKLLPKEQEQYNTIYEVKYNNSSRYDATDLIYEILKNGLAPNDKKNIGKKRGISVLIKKNFSILWHEKIRFGVMKMNIELLHLLLVNIINFI